MRLPLHKILYDVQHLNHNPDLPLVAGDLAALIDAVAEKGEKVFLVGHDWGAVMAWALCLYLPEKIKALVNLSMPFTPRNPNRKPVERLRGAYGGDYYICRFQVNSVYFTLCLCVCIFISVVFVPI